MKADGYYAFFGHNLATPTVTDFRRDSRHGDFQLKLRLFSA